MPVDVDTTPVLIVGLITGLGALGVLIWQAVRYFRDTRDD